MSFTCTLEEIGAGDLLVVGGKGANLGELVAAGLPVPRAFCVTTEAYRRVHRRTGARSAELMASPRRPRLRVPRRHRARARAIRDRIIAAPVPEEIERAVPPPMAALEIELGRRRAGLGPVLGDGRGPTRRCRSRASRTPISTSAAAASTSWHTSSDAGRRSGPTARSPTGTARDLPHEEVLPGRRGPGDVPLPGLGDPVHRQPGHVQARRDVPQCGLGPGRGGGLGPASTQTSSSSTAAR